MQAVTYSFDVFDTVLTRIWAKPTDLFWELGTLLRDEKLIQLSPEAWQSLRIKSEVQARRKMKAREITIEQIYAELAEALGWSKKQLAIAMQHEIQLERRSLHPISSSQQKIKSLRQQGKSISFISDMYLPSSVIQDLLRNHQIMTEKDTLYVSGETGVSKASGKLFGHYLSRHRLQPHELYHTGDNSHADVSMPQSLGIQSQHFVEAHLNRYEKLISEDTSLPIKFRSVLAGASRLTRLRCSETDAHRRTIWNTSANIIGPVLFGFVHWCLGEAQQRGIQRLYFIARDGQILCKIAQIICQKWQYSIDCRYFYGSRQAFHFPAMQQISETEMLWIFAGKEFVSIRDVCRRINLDPSDISATLAKFGLTEDMWDKNLSAREKKTLKKVFQDKDLVELILSNAELYREKALGYFRQEGLADGVPFATVDVGWTGRSQRSFSKLLDAGGMYPETGMLGLYFGLTGAKTGMKKAFSSDQLIPYFMKGHPPSEKRLFATPEIIELFMAADHGSTVRYEQENDRFIPVLRQEKNENALKWGLNVQQSAVLEFTDRLTSVFHPEDCPVDYFERVTTQLLKTFFSHPDKKEAAVFGSLTFAQEQAESRFEELAPVFTPTESLQAMMNSSRIHNFAWISASIQRSSTWARIPLSLARGYRYSQIYCRLAYDAVRQNNPTEAKYFFKTAVTGSPILLFSSHTWHVGALLLFRKFLNPKRYEKLRSSYKKVVRRETPAN